MIKNVIFTHTLPNSN